MFEVDVEVRGELGLEGRYALLGRIGRVFGARGLVLAGFDVRQDLHLLVDGERADVMRALRAVKSGTVQRARRRGNPLWMGATVVMPVAEPEEALVALHRRAAGEGDPLDTPWSSHRDLLGFRRATFFDAGWWDGLDPLALHLRCGGGALSTLEHPPLDMGRSLRVSAAVLGELPAHPRTFGLFAQLARWQGSRQGEIAAALMVTPRRVRQLQASPHPHLGAATRMLAHRTMRVP